MRLGSKSGWKSENGKWKLGARKWRLETKESNRGQSRFSSFGAEEPCV